MVEVTFPPKSRPDLLDIGDSIAKASRANARRFVGKLMAQGQRIGTSPMGYVGRDDLAPGLRMAALGRYVIFFRMFDGEVRIERVLHGTRNLPIVLHHDSAQVEDDSAFD
ncbi:MAG: type II toxin-antitoxin system RelE/ParE family toxin [Magnetococcales bacterium]|nr:type II toxin-antitoxin system RelE/ParE family toxin [Magnetococcales bacterium]